MSLGRSFGSMIQNQAMMPNQSAAANGLSAFRSSVAGIRERTVRSTAAAEAVAELDRSVINMKSLLIAAICVGIAFLAWEISRPKIISCGPPAEMAKAQNQVRQFVIALAIFQKDHSGAFPKDLKELKMGNYLSEEDFEKLSGGIQIDYFPPTTKSADANHVLLSGHTRNYIVYGMASGDVRASKIK